ncbi:GNAT family N-acetyltransferase [Dactylosporangium sp. CS-033363]|uniref:GNAT family N-acetyltransferase n=1 Tax=Dactylosporangium sp. CS-033363 TaxID=3239935 RepID=UPI003D8AF4F3
MKISVVRAPELGPAELGRWRALQQAEPGLNSPFLSPEFTLAVARVRPAARVAVLEDGQEIVGFFPYEVRRRVIGVPIGYGISDCQGLVHAQGLDWDPIALLRACGLPVWEFDHLMGDQAPFAPYHTETTGSPIMDLAGGYEDYLADRMKAGDVVRQANRKQRGMVRDLGEERFEWQDESPAAFDALREWKSAQYKRTQQYDRFNTPWIRDVIDDLMTSGAPGCRAVVSTVYAGDRPVAAHLGLRSESVLAYWFPSYDTDLHKYSAGILLCLRMAEAGAKDGIGHIDLGKSHAQYKDRLRNSELPVAAGRVGRSWSVTSARKAQEALTRSVKSGKVGDALRSGRTGKVLRMVKSRLAGR